MGKSLPVELAHGLVPLEFVEVLARLQQVLATVPRHPPQNTMHVVVGPYTTQKQILSTLRN